MKLVDIANTIDKSEQNEDWINLEEIGETLGLHTIPYAEQDRLKCYWIFNWYCTDTYVGYRMYFFDDEPVAFSQQIGRKYDEEFQWFSLESADKIRAYLLSFLRDDNELAVNICDINEDIGDNFKLDFNGQILKSDKVTLNGEKVEILEKFRTHPYGIDTELKVKLLSGEEKNVSVRELRFGLHTTA